MAKSIRSKQQRKMRNVKRQHYAKRDLERLKRLAVKSSELTDVIQMKSVEEIKVQKVTEVPLEGSSMEVDKPVKVFNKVTMKDEHGHYPAWMNQRAIKKQKEKVKKLKMKKKVGNKIKW